MEFARCLWRLEVQAGPRSTCLLSMVVIGLVGALHHGANGHFGPRLDQMDGRLVRAVPAAPLGGRSALLGHGLLVVSPESRALFIFQLRMRVQARVVQTVDRAHQRSRSARPVERMKPLFWDKP